MASKPERVTKSFVVDDMSSPHVDVWTQIVGGRLWGPSRPAPFRPVAFAAGDYLLLGTLVQLLGQRHIDGTARLAHCATGKLSRGGRGSGRGRAHAC